MRSDGQPDPADWQFDPEDDALDDLPRWEWGDAIADGWTQDDARDQGMAVNRWLIRRADGA